MHSAPGGHARLPCPKPKPTAGACPRRHRRRRLGPARLGGALGGRRRQRVVGRWRRQVRAGVRRQACAPELQGSSDSSLHTMSAKHISFTLFSRTCAAAVAQRSAMGTCTGSARGAPESAQARSRGAHSAGRGVHRPRAAAPGSKAARSTGEGGRPSAPFVGTTAPRSRPEGEGKGMADGCGPLSGRPRGASPWACCQ